MSRNALVIFSIAAIALCIVAAAALLRGRAGPASAQAALLDAPASSIVGMRISAPSRPGAVVVERLDDNSWQVRAESAGGAMGTAWPVNASNARGAVRVLTGLESAQSAGDRRVRDEALRIELHLSDATTRVLRFDSAVVGGTRLLEVEGRRSAYVGADVADAFLRPGPMGWRSTGALAGVGPGASRIEIETPEGALRLVRLQGRWRVDHPVRARAEEAAVRRLLRTLGEITITRFLDDDARAASADALASPLVTIRAEADLRRIDDAGDVAQRVQRRTLRLGAPADVAQTTFFADSGEGGIAFVVDAKAFESLSLDAASYVAATATGVEPADVGMITIRRESGPDLGFRREFDGWRQMRTDGALAQIDDAGPDALLSLLSRRVAPRVLFDTPPGFAARATITLFNFDNGPLDTLALGLTDAGDLVARLTPIGGDGHVYLVYAGAEPPALLADALR